MSVTSATLLPRPPRFPLLLPKPPQPHPTPLPRHSRGHGHLNSMRDLQRELDELSAEEAEIEQVTRKISNRGEAFLIPIGRSLTQLEERNDADEDSDESGSGHSGNAHSVAEDDGENESAQDLDASMEDMDDEGNTADTDENGEESGDMDAEEEEDDE